MQECTSKALTTKNQAPIVLLPESCYRHEAPVLALDLGNLTYKLDSQDESWQRAPHTAAAGGGKWAGSESMEYGSAPQSRRNRDWIEHHSEMEVAHARVLLSEHFVDVWRTRVFPENRGSRSRFLFRLKKKSTKCDRRQHEGKTHTHTLKPCTR